MVVRLNLLKSELRRGLAMGIRLQADPIRMKRIGKLDRLLISRLDRVRFEVTPCASTQGVVLQSHSYGLEDSCESSRVL